MLVFLKWNRDSHSAYLTIVRSTKEKIMAAIEIQSKTISMSLWTCSCFNSSSETSLLNMKTSFSCEGDRNIKEHL